MAVRFREFKVVTVDDCSWPILLKNSVSAHYGFAEESFCSRKPAINMQCGLSGAIEPGDHWKSLILRAVQISAFLKPFKFLGRSAYGLVFNRIDPNLPLASVCLLARYIGYQALRKV
jgi:hypothetical protein